jgi:hypothetical protein
MPQSDLSLTEVPEKHCNRLNHFKQSFQKSHLHFRVPLVCFLLSNSHKLINASFRLQNYLNVLLLVGLCVTLRLAVLSSAYTLRNRVRFIAWNVFKLLIQALVYFALGFLLANLDCLN